MAVYNTMTGGRASEAKEKLTRVIADGMASADAVVQGVLARTVSDSIVPTRIVKLVPGEGGFRMSAGGEEKGLHSHAFTQIIADAGIPKRFADDMVEQANGTPWGAELVAHNANTILAHRKTQRNLVRSEGAIVKGWLSDRFRRLDSRPLLEAFVGAVRPLGLVPIMGVATDTKARLRAVLPEVFEPVPGEAMAFGLEWGNSDYGDGGHVVNLWLMRIWCSNLAIAETALRQIHLGKRLADNIEYSDSTYRLDTKANAAALGDVVRHAIGPAQIDRMVQAIGIANGEAITGRDMAFNRLKKFLDKADAEKAADAFDSPDVVNLPAGNTAWRLSNAVSWIAQHKDVSTAKRLDLERVAGELVPHDAPKALEA